MPCLRQFVAENHNGIQAEPDWRNNLTLAKAIRF